MNNSKRIYNRIKALLALKQIKSKTLAEHLNVSEQTVSKWCTNYSQPSLPELYSIAEFLGIQVVDLLEPSYNKINEVQLRSAQPIGNNVGVALQ